MAKSAAGTSDLAKQEQRLAYWLLAPTFIVLLAIAVYPLISVFFYSFTNATFASSKPTDFVGLDNYRTLLSMTIVQVPPKLDEATGQPQIDEKTGRSSMRVPSVSCRARPCATSLSRSLTSLATNS